MSDTVKPGKLYVYSGASGVGKGTIMKELLKADDSICLSVSATTREPRPEEKNGVHYYFLSREEFDSIVAEGGFMEHATYCNNSYGTLRSEVEEKLAAGKNVFLEIDVQGALNIIKDYPDCVSIFIMPPSFETLEKRLRARNTETETQIRNRLETAMREIKLSEVYDYCVVNDDLDKAVEDVLAIVKKESEKN
ncbi:MAG: guanylate kinase [Oscillospiraceae bacterium]|nr:guanylate kinase [Oscillospiraceae bacterium]